MQHSVILGEIENGQQRIPPKRLVSIRNTEVLVLISQTVVWHALTNLQLLRE